MGDKRKIEHRVMHLDMKGPDWGDDERKIERACDKMRGKGWALASVSWPDQQNVVLTFTRPVREER